MKLYAQNVCDFCSDDALVWSYPAETYTDEQLQARNIENWLACTHYSILIERSEWTKLARRALRTPILQKLKEKIGERVALAEARAIHRGFQRHHRGAAVRIRQAA